MSQPAARANVLVKETGCRCCCCRYHLQISTNTEFFLRSLFQLLQAVRSTTYLVMGWFVCESNRAHLVLARRRQVWSTNIREMVREEKVPEKITVMKVPGKKLQNNLCGEKFLEKASVKCQEESSLVTLISSSVLLFSVFKP